MNTVTVILTGLAALLPWLVVLGLLAWFGLRIYRRRTSSGTGPGTGTGSSTGSVHGAPAPAAAPAAATSGATPPPSASTTGDPTSTQ